MLKTNLLAGIALATLAAGFAVPAAAAPTVSTGNCVTNKTSYAHTYDGGAGNVLMQGQKFRSIFGATVNFNQSQQGCVIVRFSAELDTCCYTHAGTRVRAVIDPKPGLNPILGLPAEAYYFFHKDVDNFEIEGVRSFDFVFPNVGAGPHRVVMQWAAAYVGDEIVSSIGHTVLVHHR